jgi:lipopolysaccharide transport system ATP-binding protein
MSTPAISVEKLSKMYRIGAREQQPKTTADTLKQAVMSPIAYLRRTLRPPREEEIFWALRDISFEVQRGDVLGVIGCNGAGKSTLLKILSRITEPTRGRAVIKGRVGSLLEVGTGFHPELTGRDNIYLNGTILGMKRKEIDRKFDKIVDFSGVEKFIDTPVKHYSSGMYVRLAFAVAAHLEPEILIVDEVLAVGDAEFQKKCLGKMSDVGKEGKTVLFVSHNMGAIKKLCRNSLLLDSGSIKMTGPTEDVVGKYFLKEVTVGAARVDLASHSKRLAGMKHILQAVSLQDAYGNSRNIFSQEEEIRIKIEYASLEKLAGAGFMIYSADDDLVCDGNTYMSFKPPHAIPSTGEIVFVLQPKQFLPRRYYITVSIGSHPGTLSDKVEKAIYFDISQADIHGTGYMLTKNDGFLALAFTTEIPGSAHRQKLRLNAGGETPAKADF